MQLLRTARAWGCRPSQFLGLDADVTVHERDSAGRVVRSTVKGWSQDDRDAALALEAYEADLCPGCRQPLSETTAPEREDAYVAGLPIRCHRCTASERGGERYRESPQSSALLIPVLLQED